MSSPLAPVKTTSVEQRALSEIDSTKKTFVNRDFVKNVAWLNQSVDTHTAFLSKLQKGVDDANMNTIEKIQGFAADLFVLFAGGTPTGIELGDLKYIIQGIGAMFGINPGTPFPLNLFEAALNLFQQFIIPLPQFTDVIFDSIVAWSIQFGLPQSFIDSLHELHDAILNLGESFGGLFDAIKELLGAFGFFNWDTGLIGALWDAMIDLLDLVPWNLLGGVLSLLADLGTPFINALTWLINTGANILSFISGDQIKDLGDNVAPVPANNTTIWQVGVDPVVAWVFDSSQSASSPTSSGSFKTNGTGVAKRMLTQGVFPCATGQKFLMNGKVKWTGIPSAANEVSIGLSFFNGNTEDSTLWVNIASGHGTTGGWGNFPATEIVVPDNVDNFKIALRVGNTITAGTVWIDDITVQRVGKVSLNILDGFWDVVAGFLPIEFFSNIIGIVGATLGDIADWFLKLLRKDSPISAGNIIGSLASVPLAILGIGNRNLLANPTFDGPDSLVGGGEWVWDGTVRHSVQGGSARVTGDAFPHALYSNIIEVDEEESIEMILRTKWTSVAASGTTPIGLWAKGFNDDQEEVDFVLLEGIPSPASDSDWTELSGVYQPPTNVAYVAMSFEITNLVTAGTIWVSNGVMQKKRRQGFIPSDSVDGLGDVLSNLDEFTQFLVDAFLEVVDGIPIIGGSLADFLEKIFDWFEDTLVTAAQAADAFFQAIGLNKILTKWFGAEESPGLAEAEEAVIALNGRIVALEGGGVVITRTVSGTWTNPTPTEHNLITFVCVNGGDGGAKSGAAIQDQTKGGRSGGYIQKSFYTDELPATVAFTIGAGGAGNTASGGGPGGTGGVTSFGSYLVGIKGVGAIFKPGGAIPYDTGVAPGDGGNGMWYETVSGSTPTVIPSSNGTGGPFAPGGDAGFGNLSAEAAGKPGSAAPANIPSGGGGGGGGSVTTQSFQNNGPGGAGGFPGGGGGAGARWNTDYQPGGNGAAGCIYEIRQWDGA